MTGGRGDGDFYHMVTFTLNVFSIFRIITINFIRNEIYYFHQNYEQILFI